MKRVHRFGKVVCGVVILYVLIYSVLSAFGRYEPSVVSLNGVIYAWAPLRFYDSDHPLPRSAAARRSPTQKTGGWNTFMMVTFLPLWQIDFRLIHTRSMSFNTAPEPT